MSDEAPQVVHIQVDVVEMDIDDDPGLTGYVKAKPSGEGFEFHVAIQRGLDDAEREGALDWIVRNLEQFIAIGPERAGWFAVDHDPAKGWHACARSVWLPDMSFLADVTE